MDSTQLSGEKRNVTTNLAVEFAYVQKDAFRILSDKELEELVASVDLTNDGEQ